jgi:hypothetical protein
VFPKQKGNQNIEKFLIGGDIHSIYRKELEDIEMRIEKDNEVYQV